MRRLFALVLFPAISTFACVSADTELDSDGSQPTIELGEAAQSATTPLRTKALGRMRNAAKYFHDVVARHGGYRGTTTPPT